MHSILFYAMAINTYSVCSYNDDRLILYGCPINTYVVLNINLCHRDHPEYYSYRPVVPNIVMTEFNFYITISYLSHPLFIQ